MSARQPQPFDVFPAMNPVVARSAKRDEIEHVESTRFISCPRLNVVGVQAAPSDLGRCAMHTAVAVSLENGPHDGFPFRRSVKALPFGCAPIPVVRVAGAGASRHSVSCASQVRLRYGRLGAENGTRLFGMGFPGKGIYRARAAHVVVLSGKVFTSRTRRNSEVFQLFVNALRISANQCTDFVSRQALDFVFLTKPVGIEMGRLVGHASILNGVA